MAYNSLEMPPPTRYDSVPQLQQALNGPRRTVTVDVEQFVRTRDALTSAYTLLSQSIDEAVKAYVNHTNTIIQADGALNASLLLEPFNRLTQSAQQVAQQALSAQGNGAIDPQLLQNGDAHDKDNDKKKRTKRAYKQRDPNAPKRPLTAYFRYLGEKRPEIMEEVKQNPQKFEDAGKPGDISRIATKRWNELTKDQQWPYKLSYREALKGYTREVEEYKKATGQEYDETKLDIDETEIDPELEADAGAAGMEKPVAESSSEESSDSESSDSDSDAEGESDAEVAKPAPPPPPQKKSAPTSKASKKSAKAAQTFSSIPEVSATPAPRSTSPEKKRKAAVEPEDTSKSSKKRKGRKTVTAGADLISSPAAAPTAVMQSSPPAADTSSKKSKKDKKKRKSSVEA